MRSENNGEQERKEKCQEKSNKRNEHELKLKKH